MAMAILLLIDNHLLLYKIGINTIILAYVDMGLMYFYDVDSDPDDRSQRPLTYAYDM